MFVKRAQPRFFPSRCGRLTFLLNEICLYLLIYEYCGFLIFLINKRLPDVDGYSKP